ncbi:MAG: hypothetical protein JST64_08525, partial [Actinobacteria bacterium]|nr:hypothetical protein [Actinomycetota bacterium]
MEEESSTVGGAAPGSSRPRVARGSARPLVHDAVDRLLTGVTLDDLTAFLTVNRLAEESGLSTGAIYSAYQPSDGHGDRRRSAPQTAAREVFLSFPSSGDGLSIEILAAMKHVVLHGSTDREIIETLTGIIGSHVEASARGESGWDYTHFALSLAVALNDREVRERLSASYEEIHAGYVELVTVILDLTERVPIDGLSVMDLTWMVVDVADAGALRVRAGPDTQDGMVARMMQVVFAATTRRRDDDDDDALRRFAFGAVVATDDERSRIADAVRRIAARSGWGEVTLTRVANLAGVDRSALVS